MPTGATGIVISRRRLLLGALNALLDLAHVLEILIEPDLVARAQPTLEAGHIALHRVEDAAVLFHAPHALFGRSRAPEHPFEDDARVRLHRHRRGRRLPRDRVHVGAAVSDVARAHVSGEVLGADLERREHRVAPDLAGDDLIE